MAVTEVVVAYDVSADDRRARVAARLSRVGIRLQRSVFQCHVDGEALKVVLAEIGSMIDPATDVVHVFRQCAECVEGRSEMGQAPPDLGTRFWIV